MRAIAGHGGFWMFKIPWQQPDQTLIIKLVISHNLVSHNILIINQAHLLLFD